MSAYGGLLASLKTRRVATILFTFWFSVAFIFILSKTTDTTELTDKLAAVSGNGVFTGKFKEGCTISNRELREKTILAGESRYAHLIEDKFTIAISTYKRPKELNYTLTTLLTPHIPSLHEIVIVWNDVDDTPPPSFTSSHGVPVRYRASSVNSLNQKLTPDPSFKTQAILLSDDDVFYHPPDLEFAFQTWRKWGRRRVTGALARCAYPRPPKNIEVSTKVTEWDYTFCEKTHDYSMILTNLAFSHIGFLDYYSSENGPMPEIRKYVDEKFNCEDIALNFVVSMLTCEGPILVKGEKEYYNSNPGVGISMKPGHLEARSRCLGDLAGMVGYMSLVPEEQRVGKAVRID